MSFNNVIKFMKQQDEVLKELEDLIAHDEKQESPGHSVQKEDIEALKTYVTNMRQAVNAASTLAKYYENKGKESTDKQEKQENKSSSKSKTKSSKSNKKSTKKQDSEKNEPANTEPENTEPAQNEPVDNTENKEPAAGEKDVTEEFDFLN